MKAQRGRPAQGHTPSQDRDRTPPHTPRLALMQAAPPREAAGRDRERGQGWQWPLQCSDPCPRSEAMPPLVSVRGQRGQASGARETEIPEVPPRSAGPTPRPAVGPQGQSRPATDAASPQFLGRRPSTDLPSQEAWLGGGAFFSDQSSVQLDQSGKQGVPGTGSPLALPSRWLWKGVRGCVTCLALSPPLPSRDQAGGAAFLFFFFFLSSFLIIGSNHKGPQGMWGGREPGSGRGWLPAPPPHCHPLPSKCVWAKVPDPLNNPEKPG